MSGGFTFQVNHLVPDVLLLFEKVCEFREQVVSHALETRNFVKKIYKFSSESTLNLFDSPVKALDIQRGNRHQIIAFDSLSNPNLSALFLLLDYEPVVK